MIINGKTGAQLWAEQLNRGRKFILLARIAKLLDFADSFSPLKVELRLQALDLLPLKRIARPGEAPLFTISPRIGITVAPTTRETRVFLNLLKRPHHYQTTVLSLRPRTVPGSSQGSGTVSVLRNVSTRIHAVSRLIEKVLELKAVSLRGLPVVLAPLPASGSLETAPNPAQKASRLIENIYRYQQVSLNGREPGEGLSGPNPVRGTVPLERVYARRRDAASEVEDILAASDFIPGGMHYNRSGSNGSRKLHNIHRLISYVFSTAAKETTNRTGGIERGVEPGRSTGFYPLQRLDIRKVDRPPETMGFIVQQQSRPEPAVLPGAMEMVTKKIKTIEKQVDTEAVEQTVIRKVSEQVDRTVRQRLEKHPVFRPGQTQRLEENIYSRLVSRIALEKERVEY
jgi:hypothetical protein